MTAMFYKALSVNTLFDYFKLFSINNKKQPRKNKNRILSCFAKFSFLVVFKMRPVSIAGRLWFSRVTSCRQPIKMIILPSQYMFRPQYFVIIYIQHTVSYPTMPYEMSKSHATILRSTQEFMSDLPLNSSLISIFLLFRSQKYFPKQSDLRITQFTCTYVTITLQTNLFTLLPRRRHFNNKIVRWRQNNVPCVINVCKNWPESHPNRWLYYLTQPSLIFAERLVLPSDYVLRIQKM